LPILSNDSETGLKFRLVPAVLFPFLLLLANFLIVRKFFVVEYTPYLMTTEGLFIALARGVAGHPWDLFWWPLWDCGVPFQNAYSPLLGIFAGVYSRVTGWSAALSIHQLAAAAFCLSPVFLYLMAWVMTRKPVASFMAALAYTAFSPCALLVPSIRHEIGPWNLRRLHILVHYGESPHIAAMALLPLAILCLYLLVSRRPFWPGVGAGIAMGAAMLVNAFAAVIVGMVGLCLLFTLCRDRFWKCLGYLLATGGLTYAWISPLSPPSVLAAIRVNSPTVDGDFRFTMRSLMGVLVLAAGFALLRWALRKIASAELQCFWLFAFLTSGIVLLGELARVYVVPQPNRYQIAMDMAICLAVVFSGAELFRTRPRLSQGAAIAVFLVSGVFIRHDARFARGLIRSVDITTTAPYLLARKLDQRLPGQRVMIPGSYSFFINDFSDVPQVLGGADPMLPNFLMRVAGYEVYSGAGTGARDGEISILWLKALGARAVVVPGPDSAEFYKPFANPNKFEGRLPVLWREAGDTVYAIPARSVSLAHVVPVGSVVHDEPINGLDTAEIEQYLEAIDDPALPEASLVWKDRHTAAIHAQVQAGQVISLQVTYVPGWRAEANGLPLDVEKDGLGLIELEPPCQGACEITLVYNGGTEWRLACAASLITMAGVIACAINDLRKRR
jgi:hypothetical protein